MYINVKQLFLLVGLLFASTAFAAKEVNVVYPDWFKQSLYDLKDDLQDARDKGKKGIMLFFSMKTCSYCNAIIETTFQQADIVKNLRKNYDVIGFDVFSDIEVVDIKGKSHWAKNFFIAEKATFTPTMIFYDINGTRQLRLLGYQSPEKFRAALDYLEGGHYTRIKLRDFMHQRKSTPVYAKEQTGDLNLNRRGVSDKPLMVIFESADCAKCKQLRKMLQASVLQPYTKRLSTAYVRSADMTANITIPGGNKLSAKDWTNKLGLIHSPAMVFFNDQGKEVLRIDTDILMDSHGKAVAVNDAHVLDNIRARLQYVLDKGYISMPQFQRWRAQQNKLKKNNRDLK